MCRHANINHDGKFDAIFGNKGRLLDWYKQGTQVADIDCDGDLDIISVG